MHLSSVHTRMQAPVREAQRELPAPIILYITRFPDFRATGNASPFPRAFKIQNKRTTDIVERMAMNMSMAIGKRQIVLATLVVALGAAVFVNWYYTKPDAERANTGVTISEQATQAAGNLGDALLVNSSTIASEGSTKASDTQQAQAGAEEEYFAQARLNRSTAHDEAAEALNKVIEDSSASAEAVKLATEELAELSNAIKLEADIENLIHAKIGSSCVVVIGNATAQVVIGKGVLTDTILVQIKEIVLNQTGFSVDKITVIEAK